MTANATPTPEALESTGPPSATAEECAFDRAFTFCSPPVVVTWTEPPEPATYASVAESNRLNERAPAYWRSPSAVWALPVVSVGPLAVRLAGDASFPLEPPRLAREVEVTEPSESARTFRLAATTVADPPIDALVRWVTFASAIPAPPVAALASPLADAATRFVAEIVRSPVAVIDVEPATLTVAVLLMSAPATATSAPGVPSPGLATAFIGAVTVDAAESDTPPVAFSTDAPPTVTVAAESACKPMNFELGDGGATVEVAEIAMVPPLRLASVSVADADPVAFTSPLSAEPLWSFAA